MPGALFRAELNERLFTHFVNGRWRAPRGVRLLPVMQIAPGRAGRIVCAGGEDLARLRLEPAPAGAAAAGYAAARPALVALRHDEGFDDPVTEPCAAPALPGAGPLVLLSAAATPVALLAGVLLAGAARGVLWKPAPGAAASAHLLMQALAPATGRAVALVQGDHATGALAAGQGALVWASPAPAPLPAALSLAARVPPRP